MERFFSPFGSTNVLPSNEKGDINVFTNDGRSSKFFCDVKSRSFDFDYLFTYDNYFTYVLDLSAGKEEIAG